jgi:cytochrome c oxidase subunit II
MTQSRILPLLPVLLVGLVACHSGNTMDTLVAQSDLTTSILAIYERIFWWTVLLFIVVQGGLIYIVMRFRARGDETTLPEQVHGNSQLEITWTVLPVVILMHIAIPTVQFIFKSQEAPGPDALKVNAVGKQWWFAFEYPAEGVVTANELHVPLGRQVNIRLQSDNVIHSLWAPQIFAKRDMVPGRVNQITFKATKAGEYLGQCAEYCGDSHSLMQFRVYVDTPEDFAKWVANQKSDAVAEAVPAGSEIVKAKCGSCHTVKGVTEVANIGPNLTHVGSRTTIAAGILLNNTENLKKWISNPAGVKPGSKMIQVGLTPQELDSVVSYLQTLK